MGVDSKFCHIFCIKCNDSTEVFSFKCVSLFVICKTIDLSIEKVCTLKTLRSGDFVEVNSTKQSQLQLRTFSVTVMLHNYFNTFHGFISETNLLYMQLKKKFYRIPVI